MAALADDHLATSVSTLSFKNQFVASGIVPEVIAALDPSVSFYAGYKAGADRHDELLTPGSSLSVSEATMPFEFSVENLNNATNITAQTRFLIYLLDADAPSRSTPTARNLRHYLAGNYTRAGTNSTILPTAQRLSIQSAQLRPFTQFTNPSPEPDTGVHRFIYALYVQPARFNNAGFESVGMEAEPRNWNLSRWRTQLGLGPAIGATFFTIDTASNSTGTSGGSATAGTTPGNSAAGSLAPLGLNGLTALALLGLLATI
ncbi:phosphatidylethanolamine-binding protein 4 [Staphylotrichum tortipilum]|uniref:Phosphatidylethanolamine-binding protein 4 n=1 Tax=Staphylotrichum tortipilum TaxID=2831512 RepID=A0AAN6MQT1_9PEZI|nr:phosphatidylethanolamine-binding protein 4 [Staphylotrichum longicolle]